jgi:hypothetical protein
MFDTQFVQGALVALATLLAVAGGALGRRLSGGLIAKVLPFRVGTQVGRLCDALLVGLCFIPLVLLLGHPWWAAGLIAAQIMLIDMLQGFPLGPPDTEGKRGSIMVPETLRHVVLVSAMNGLVPLLPSMVLIYSLDDPLSAMMLLAAGLLHGPAYWAATLRQPRWRWCDILNRDGILEKPPLAELYVGGIRSLAFALTILI